MSPCMSRKSPSLSKSVGTISLEQFRAQLVQDLAGRAVQAEDIDEFLDQLLPFPGANKRRKRACQKPPKEVNPFAALENADKMTEADVVRLFVSTIQLNMIRDLMDPLGQRYRRPRPCTRDGIQPLRPAAGVQQAFYDQGQEGQGHPTTE